MDQIVPHEGVLTIGVAAHGNVATTLECLKCIFDSVSGDFELILIDDASPDDILSLFRDAAKYHPNTTIFHFPENLDYTQSVNCLLSEATGKRILFVSNDIMITPAYVAALLETMADPTIGIARGTSNFVDNRLATHNLTEKPSAPGWDSLAEFAAARYMVTDSPPIEDPFLVGDAFMVSRKLLDTIVGFDTAYVGYFSDIDFGLRAVGAGFRRVLCPRAYAWHVVEANFNYLDVAERERKWQRRRDRVSAAWKVFRSNWGLDDLPDTWVGIPKIPFQELDPIAGAQRALSVAKLSYAKYRIHPQ